MSPARSAQARARRAASTWPWRSRCASSRSCAASPHRRAAGRRRSAPPALPGLRRRPRCSARRPCMSSARSRTASRRKPGAAIPARHRPSVSASARATWSATVSLA
jgi:hypothetical protein